MYKVKSGWEVYKNTLKFIFKKPFMLIPLMAAWAVCAGSVYYVNSIYNLASLETGYIFLVAFGFTCISTFTIGIASLFILELLEQHETTGRMNPFVALFDMLKKDLWRALPLIIVWSIVDFALMVIIAFLNSTRKSKNRPRRPKGPLQRAVEAFKDLVRMGSMTAFTVIAWESLGSRVSFDKGFGVFKKQFAEMLTGFGLNKITGFLLGIPVLIAVVILQNGMETSTTFIIILIVYISIVWSVGKLIEQLFVSEMYLWYRHYEKACDKAVEWGETPPTSMYDVPKPSFSDNNFDLVDENRY